MSFCGWSQGLFAHDIAVSHRKIGITHHWELPIQTCCKGFKAERGIGIDHLHHPLEHGTVVGRMIVRRFRMNRSSGIMRLEQIVVEDTPAVDPCVAMPLRHFIDMCIHCRTCFDDVLYEVEAFVQIRYDRILPVGMGLVIAARDVYARYAQTVLFEGHHIGN